MLAVAPQNPPDSIGSVDKSPVTVPLSAEEFRDPRNVDLSVSLGAPSRITATRGGTVTRFDCSVGKELKSGTAAVWIDDAPQLALATATPLWRDLTLGHRGKDVVSLQRELSRLGFSTQVNGRFDRQTDEALKDAFEGIGWTKKSKGLPTERIVWIPKATVSYSTCETETGSVVNQGSPIATTGSKIRGFGLKAVPANVVEGPRVVSLAGVTAQVNQAGQITDPVSITKLAETAAVQSMQDSTPAPSLTAIYELVTPLTVYPAPPSSLIGLRGASGCVATATGRTVPVRVVSSILGRSLIVPVSGETMRDVVLAPPEEAACAS